MTNTSPSPPGIEIERKWLPANDSWHAMARDHYRIAQGYLTSPSSRYTIRIRSQTRPGFAPEYILCIKGRTACDAGIVRTEDEFPVGPAIGQHMMEQARDRVVKLRYRVPFEGVVFEIDQFLGRNQGLVVCELELSSVDQPVPAAPWLGQEVSTDPRYYNTNLAREPWTSWPENGDKLTDEFGWSSPFPTPELEVLDPPLRLRRDHMFVALRNSGAKGRAIAIATCPTHRRTFSVVNSYQRNRSRYKRGFVHLTNNTPIPDGWYDNRKSPVMRELWLGNAMVARYDSCDCAPDRPVDCGGLLPPWGTYPDLPTNHPR